MNPLQLPSSNVSADWLYFIAILLAVGIGIAGFVLWLFIFRKSGKKKRKQRHRHHRQVNPTLAQAGGLPPVRQAGEPPKGV
jgi:hypothetical protein